MLIVEKITERAALIYTFFNIFPALWRTGLRIVLIFNWFTIFLFTYLFSYISEAIYSHYTSYLHDLKDMLAVEEYIEDLT